MINAKTELARCDAEIAQAETYLMQGGPEEHGAYVGLIDWQAERRLIERERYATFLAKKRATHGEACQSSGAP